MKEKLCKILLAVSFLFLVSDFLYGAKILKGILENFFRMTNTCSRNY